LIMVYPTRSLVDDQIGRFQRMLASRSKYADGRTFTLVVDTGAQSRRYTWRDGEGIDVPGNPRRHLYQGDVIITTLDKFLYRFFGFGEPGKSYTF
jgi:CRISPR-associated endonuclease/helicase Cas3